MLHALKPSKRKATLVIFWCILSLKVFSQQDTVTLSISDAEKILLDSNLQVMASYYNVDAAKALIQQAKLWDNPVLATDQVVAANGKFFPYKSKDGGGQYFIQVQQLIKTAGKRGKQINLATTNARINELSLQDLVRNLRYQLHTDYYTLGQQLQNIKLLQDQLTQVNRLLTGMQAQLNAGNISRKDYLRIQALQVGLQQDYNDALRTISDNEAEIKTLLKTNNTTFISPVLSDSLVTASANNIVIDSVYSMALRSNPAFLIQQQSGLYQQQNLAYQKALRAPDITVGPEFDKNSNFAPNYVGLAISLPLLVFNRNQGNIKAAAFNIKQQNAITENTAVEVKNNVQSALNKFLLLQQQNTPQQLTFYEDYNKMFSGVLQSYERRQIGLLEFIDFADTYRETLLRQQQQRLNLQLAKEEVNYHAGADVIK